MRDKHVKIVATIGPASHSAKDLLELAEAGVDVFRINLSHATAEEVEQRCGWIREAEAKIDKPLAIMGDLPGPKIRITPVKPDVVLEKGQKFIFSKDITVGDEKGCGLNHPEIIDILEIGAIIFIDDGTLKLKVEKKLSDAVEATVLAGGSLKSKKGFSAEGISLSTTGVSDKDKEGIAMMVKNNADALAVSFVQTRRDMVAVRTLLPEDSKIMLIAKIETAQGVENAEDILSVSDGLMVARGDLGLSVPFATVPHIQKQLIELCVKKAKPVITATQMLESMISKPIPTRAEVTDVSNAILDRTDAIMLSAETAEGKFPVESVETMVKIIDESLQWLKPYEYKEENTTDNSISDHVGRIADQVGATLIIAFTHSGITARRISRHRHKQAIIAVSPNAAMMRGLNFSWGVYPRLIKPTKSFEDMREQARELAMKNGIVDLIKGDKYLIAAGMPFGQSGNTNMILVQVV